MGFFRDIEKGNRSNEEDLDETATLPSDNSKTKVVPPIEPSVVSVVESLHERHRQEDENERQSPLCCGSCCDLLRACIICDIVFILLDIVGILLFFAGITMNNARAYDDDAYDDEEKNSDCWGCNSNILTVLITKNCLGMVFCTVGIIGAVKFNKNLVLITAIWYVIDCIWSIITGRWTGIVVTACFAYPHFALFLAFKKHQITRENYLRERHCCCDKE